MKLSARNIIKGKVIDIARGPATAKVKVDVGNGVVITSSITTEAADDLGLVVGDVVSAVIKSSDVMIGNTSVRSKAE